MGRNLTVHRAADGSDVNLRSSGPLPDFAEPWFGHVVFRPEGPKGFGSRSVFGLNVGPSATVEPGIVAIQGTRRHEQAFKGGQAVIVDGTNPVSGEPITAAGWIGPWNVAWGLHYPPSNQTGDLMAVLERLDFTDTPHGLVAYAPGWEILNVRATLMMPDLGRVVLENIAAAGVRRPAPKWAGLRLRAGEAWRINRTEDGRRVEALVLASDTALATVLPTAGRTMQDALDFADQLSEMSWRAAVVA